MFHGNFVNKYCQVCQGTITPAGLTITDNIPEKKEGEVGKPLSKATAGRELCALCGQPRSLNRAYGKRICAGCSQIAANSRNNPQLVIDIFNEYSNDFPFPGTSGAGDQTQAEKNMQDEIARLKESVDVKAGVIAKLEESVKKLRALLDGKDRELSSATDEIERFKKEASTIKTNVAHANYDKGKIMIILADIAQAHIEGKVSVRADCFVELRKAATA